MLELVLLLLVLLEITLEEVVLVLCSCWLVKLLALELLMVCTVDFRCDWTRDLLEELFPLLSLGVSSMDCCNLTDSELIFVLPFPSS